MFIYIFIFVFLWWSDLFILHEFESNIYLLDALYVNYDVSFVAYLINYNSKAQRIKWIPLLSMCLYWCTIGLLITLWFSRESLT